MTNPKNQKKRHYLAAVVLGTALAAMGQPSQAAAADISGQAIQDISRYCTACWRNARVPVDRWNDCTQEVFQRLLERLQPGAWDQVLASEGQERKEFMRAIDAVKKRTQRERQKSVLHDDMVADARTLDHQFHREEQDAVQQAAHQLLTPRQQRILQLTGEGWSIPEMAQQLETTTDRISDEKYKAIQKLRAFFKNHPEGRL